VIILVTGSRTWSDVELIKNELFHAVGTEHPKDIWIRHGKCPRGADLIAHQIAVFNGWNVFVHPADWERYGKRAGFVRNAEMTKLGANKCLAFIENNSPGATMCADLAEEAGIPVTRIYK
jgi:hypothetical protein